MVQTHVTVGIVSLPLVRTANTQYFGVEAVGHSTVPVINYVLRVPYTITQVHGSQFYVTSLSIFGFSLIFAS